MAALRRSPPLSNALGWSIWRASSPSWARRMRCSDSGVRGLEGLAARAGWLRGDGATALEIREHDWRLGLDVAEGRAADRWAW